MHSFITIECRCLILWHPLIRTPIPLLENLVHAIVKAEKTHSLSPASKRPLGTSEAVDMNYLRTGGSSGIYFHQRVEAQCPSSIIRLQKEKSLAVCKDK